MSELEVTRLRMKLISAAEVTEFTKTINSFTEELRPTEPLKFAVREMVK